MPSFSQYYSPVGVQKSDRQTKVWLYNPGDSAITVTVETYDGVAGTVTYNKTVTAGSAVSTDAIPDGSGVRVYTTNQADDFFALSQSDAELKVGNNNGQSSDWGK